jgi:hypothetical protein
VNRGAIAERTVQLHALDFMVELNNPINQGFGARWATSDIDVDRDDFIDTLHDGVVIEHAAA